jgi:hypothetical protein
MPEIDLRAMTSLGIGKPFFWYKVTTREAKTLPIGGKFPKLAEAYRRGHTARWGMCLRADGSADIPYTKVLANRSRALLGDESAISEHSLAKLRQGQWRPGPEWFERFRKVVSFQSELPAGSDQSAASRAQDLQIKRSAAIAELVAAYYGTAKPIAQQLRDARTAQDLRNFLLQFSRSRANTFLIRHSLDEITSPDEQMRIAISACQLCDEDFGLGRRSMELAPLVVHHLSERVPLAREIPAYHSLIEKVAKVLADTNGFDVSEIEPICMSGMLQDLPDPFIENLQRLIESAEWRDKDCQTAIRYHSNPADAIESIVRHIERRRSEVHCHDLGRIIGACAALDRIYGANFSAKIKSDLISKMEESLRTLQPGKGLIGKFHDLARC